MNSATMKTPRLMTALVIAGLCALPLMQGGCNRTESKTTEETKKVVNTPEGKKTVTEKSETKVTTDGK